MKKCILFLALSFFVQLAWASKKWNQHYKIVKKDIQTIEALRTKDLGLRIRLFELYGEKLTLLLEKENEQKLKYLTSGNRSQLKQVMSLQKSTLVRIEKIAQKIERQTKNLKVLTKINYYRALNYYLTKNKKRFYFHIKRAEKTNKDAKLALLIQTKLADYHYNENQFKKSSFYYRKLLKDKTNGWITKYLYNLAWSELKLNQFASALNRIKQAYEYEKKPGYFKIGAQLEDALLLFHAFAGKTQEGLAFIRQNKLGSFKNYLTFLHYVFENGNRESTKYVIARIEGLKKNTDQEFQFLEKKVIVYRALKSFTLIQKNFAVFKGRLKTLKQKDVKPETRSALKNAVLGYTGYLQELIKSKRLISEKYKKKYIRFVGYNFNVLRLIDPANRMEYSYYEGETYFALKNFKRASFVYASGLKKYDEKKDGKNKFVTKTFDSLFKSLEKQNKPPTNILLFAFNTYLRIFPKGEKSRQVHRRLINYYQAKGSTKKMLQALKKYNQFYPDDIALQRDYYKSILNKYIDKKDAKALSTLGAMIDKGFLNFSNAESKKIGLILVQIYFSKYEEMAKQGKLDEAIKGFDQLQRDEKVTYNLRAEALRKKMYFLQSAYRFKELSAAILTSFSFLKPPKKKSMNKEYNAYVLNICIGGLLDECLDLTKALQKDLSINVDSSLVDLFFKVYVSKEGKFNEAYKLANTSEKKNYLFKNLLGKDPSFKNKLYTKFYAVPSMKNIINAEVERKFLNSFFNSFSFRSFERYLADLAIPQLKQRFTQKITLLKKQFQIAKFKFVKTPDPQDIKAEDFGRFGMEFNQNITNIINDINLGISKMDPNFLPYFLTVLVSSFENETKKFKSFIPISKDAALETAMNDELAKLHQFLDQKIIEYRTLYFEAVQKTRFLAGARKYHDELMKKSQNLNVGKVDLWSR